MQIPVGDYIIKSDPYNIWIEKKYKYKRKSKSGEEVEKEGYRNFTGYHHTWTGVINSFISKRINNSDAEELEGVLLVIAEAKREAIELSLAAYEKGKGAIAS